MFAYEMHQHRSAELQRQAAHHRRVRQALAARKQRKHEARSRTAGPQWVKAA